MSKINFKQEQIDVLESENKNLIVSASAGSGKTTVMIQKIINLITQKNKKIKEVLVLTYTKASAEEMKQKLLSALYEEASKNPKILEQIDDVAVADISTIHSFFQKMLKKHFTILELNPNFTLVDENKVLKLKEKAMENAYEIFENKFANQAESLIEIYGKNRNEKTIKNLVFDLNKFLLAVDDPKKWCEDTAVKLYEQNFEKNLAIKILNEEIYLATKYFVSQLEKLQVSCAQIGAVKYVEHINVLLASLENIKENSISFFENNAVFSNFPRITVYKDEDFMAEYEKFSAIRKSLKFFIEKVKNWGFCDIGFVKNSLEKIKFNVMAICNLQTIYQAEFAKIKLEKNCLDYEDLEKFMLKLVENKTVGDEIKNAYAEIFIDEYQDANRVQEKIINSICKPNNRFMVGDVKQSIYRFRQAEPDLFLEKQDLFLADELSEVMFLNCNFRSERKILDFINIVFNKIMTVQTSKVDYKNTSQLNGQADYKAIESQILPAVEINIIQKEKDEKKPEPSKIYRVKEHLETVGNYTNAELEAFLVAKKISEIIGKKIYIPAEGLEREISFRDITILLRSRGKYLDEFCGILSKFNIPIYANTNVPLYADSDILVLLNLLKLCKNSRDDIALASVMHSVFGGFSFNELAQIRLSGDKKAPFYDCVKNYQKNNKIKEKLDKFNKFLIDFEFNMVYQGIYFSLNLIIKQYDFETYVLRKKDGIEKLEKVKKFVSDFLVNDFNFDPYGFLFFAEQNFNSIQAPNYVSGENCVNITTIHSSKGLEYPVVIVANAGQDFTKEPFDAEIKINQKLGVGLKFYDKSQRKKFTSLAYEAILKRNKEESFAEKLRLLYVALSRAKNHLIIVGTTEKAFVEISNDYETKNQKTYLNLIVGALPESEIEDINASKNVENKNYSINIFKDNYEENFMENNRVVSGKENEEVIRIFEKYFNYKYPHKTNYAIKNSVSGIMKENEPYISQNFSPKNLTLAEHLSENSAEIGSLYHLVLEEIDFNKVNKIKDIEDFIKTKNYENAEILSTEKIFESIVLIKSLPQGKIIKEQKFVMSVPHNEVVENGSSEKILIQGIIDLLILGDKNILIDYKFTNLTDESKIIEKYKLQLKLYKKSAEYALNMKIDEVYLLLIKSSKLIKLPNAVIEK